MDEFRLALIGIGIFAIAGILAHGMWTIRKNNKAKQDAENEAMRRDEPDFVISDDDPLLFGEQEFAEHPANGQGESVQQEPIADSADEYDPLVGDQPLYAASDVDTPVVKPSRPEPPVTETVNESYDEDGIGAVRVVAEKPAASAPAKATIPAPEPKVEVAEELPEPPSSLLRKEDSGESHRKVSVDDIPMIDTSIDIEEMPRRASALKSEHTRTEVVGGNKMGRSTESIADKARKLVGRKSDEPVAKPKKSKAADKDKDQIGLDLETSPERESLEAADKSAQDAPQSEVLILNVRVPEGKVIHGAALLPSLLTLGFKFGEHNMFHRHAASNGKGPRLFTLANMFNPGTFDIDNMENFNTRGLSLFMTLPIDADAHQVFNMMHNAARKLADEFGAQVLDGRRSVLTKQSLQQYVEKIREFERRRMIRRA
ncbi:cell division protein ZipA [Planctobacterium marinum]|uniref:Cell division protein ZipA n=1 Tax=Planctobacterium marinum TaxID=1631968 RepID=A0AA48KQ03_9ALTE|nr:hypothetical protein MACH26_15240 [Planctobacterium marinum]